MRAAATPSGPRISSVTKKNVMSLSGASVHATAAQINQTTRMMTSSRMPTCSMLMALDHAGTRRPGGAQSELF
jgi:hypothetical protein